MARGSGQDDRGGWNTSAADEYQRYAQQFTIQAGEDLIKEAGSVLPFSTPSTFVLDNGCGTGSVTAALHASSPATAVLAVDNAEKMVELLAAKNIPNVKAKQGDALDLSTLGAEGRDNTFSHALSTFMIQFTDDANLAVREMHRVVRSQGVIGLGTWGNHDLYKLCQRVGQQLDPSWEMPSPYSMQWPVDEDGVRRALEEIGFVDIKVWTSKIPFKGMLEYAFSGRNPANEKVLRAWRENGRFYELRDAMMSTVKQEKIEYLNSEVLLAVARKK